MYRENCFWHYTFQDMSAVIHQCDLAEPWTCPCDWDCYWFVSKIGVKAHIYNLQSKAKELLKED